MSIQVATEDRSTLQSALSAAVCHVSDLDLSISDGNYPVIPAVIAWMMEKSEPSLMSEVGEKGLRDQLIQLLEEYGRLREHAIKLQEHARYDGYELPDYERPPLPLEFYDIADAFYAGGFVATELFREIFDTISADICNQLDELDAVEWGEPEPVAPVEMHAGSESERAPLFDHHKGYWDSRRTDRFPKEWEPLDFAVKLMADELGKMDNGRHENFWTTVDVSVVVGWLANDWPALYGVMVERNCIDHMYAEIASYVASQCEVEYAWARLGHVLRYLMRQHTDSQEALWLIAEVLAEDKVNGHLAAQEVYEMFCRRHALPGVSSVAKHRETTDSTPTIERIRSNLASFDTCYVIDRKALPRTVRPMTAERHCLAVRLSEEWCPLVDTLSTDRGLEVLYTQHKVSGEFRRNLTPSRSFWASFDDLFPFLTGFRSSLPVLFVLNEVAILVVYRFNRFADIRRLTMIPPRDPMVFTIEDDDWKHAAAHYTYATDEGKQVKPVIVSYVCDLIQPVNSDGPTVTL